MLVCQVVQVSLCGAISEVKFHDTALDLSAEELLEPLVPEGISAVLIFWGRVQQVQSECNPSAIRVQAVVLWSFSNEVWHTS